MALAYDRHHITLDEYHRMVEAGVFDEDARIELLRGELIETMAPIREPHAYAVRRLNRFFVQRLGAHATIDCQNPVTLPSDSEPQPDLTVARLDARDYLDHHPEPDDILLLVEVAHSTLDLDRAKKLPIYAEAGIAETWIVNLVDDCIEIYRDPVKGRFQTTTIARRGETFEMLAFPGERFAVDDILPPRE